MNRLVSFVMLFSAAITVAFPVAGQQGGNSLSVWDSRGTKVGDVAGFEGPFPIVVLRVDRLPVPIVIGKDRVLSTVGGLNGIGLYFESTDCSGVPFLANGALFPDPPTPFPVTYLFGQQILTFIDGVKPVTVRSIAGDPLNPSICVPIGAVAVQTVELRMILDLETKYTPPFAAR